MVDCDLIGYEYKGPHSSVSMAMWVFLGSPPDRGWGMTETNPHEPECLKHCWGRCYSQYTLTHEYTVSHRSGLLIVALYVLEDGVHWYACAAEMKLWTCIV